MLVVAVVETFDPTHEGLQQDQHRTGRAHQGDRENEESCPQVLQLFTSSTIIVTTPQATCPEETCPNLQVSYLEPDVLQEFCGLPVQPSGVRVPAFFSRKISSRDKRGGSMSR